MKKTGVVAVLLLTLLWTTAGSASAEEKWESIYGSGAKRFSLATGSPGELGLVKALADRFCAKTDATLLWKKAGSGVSLKALQDKSVDMIMVHAPAAEKKAVEEGWAVKRTLIGSNEFFIVGPPSDPAKISEAPSASGAYLRIANAKAKFLSRGDNSGTHKKEMAIWKQAGLNPTGDWYIVTRDFMSATLKRADKEKGYFMTDSSTWAAESKNVPGLKILFKGDKFLVNTYHALCQPEGTTPGAKTASMFIDFVASGEGQQIIRDYGKDLHGAGLYNDAKYAEKYDD